jgi:choline kinase
MTTRLAVILAAGVGSRLRPLTDDLPKALVPVSGKTILSRALAHLVGVGVSKLVVASGYRQEALERALGDAPLDVAFCVNTEYERTQNSVSLALCRDLLEGESFFRLDGDVVFDREILTRLEALDTKEEGKVGIVAAVDRGRMLDEEAMKVRADATGRIAAFGKQIPVSESAGESIGIERISAFATTPLFDALDRARRAGDTHLYYEDVYSQLIRVGLPIVAADVTACRWCEVDSAQDLALAERMFAT